MEGWEDVWSGGMMSPWANSWGGQPQGIAQSIIQDQVAPIGGVPSDGNGLGGYSTPSNQSTGPQTPDEAQRSREVMGQLGGYTAGRLGNTAMGAVGATLGGFTPGIGDVVSAGVRGLMDPAGLSALGGRIGAQQMGFTGFQPGMARTATSVVSPVIGGLLSALNPLAGLAYGIVSPFAIDGLADAFDGRKDEGYKDAMEDAHGAFGGRSISKEIAGMMDRAGFSGMTQGYGNQGIGPADAARGMSNKDASSVARGGNPMGNSYGAARGIGFSNAIGGPTGGARAVDAGYGQSMGGYAGLGIGNPSSYGGGNTSDSGGKSSDKGGGYGGHAGDKDGSSTGFGR